MNSEVTTHTYGFRVSRLCLARPRGYLDHAGVWKAREICRVRPYRPMSSMWRWPRLMA